MNRVELFEELKSWLKTEELRFGADDETSQAHLRMRLENGSVQLRLICEDDPALLQVIVTHPVKVPKERVTGTALLLHNINSGMRMGSFQLNSEDRTITFRVAFPICEETALDLQFNTALGTTVSTLDSWLHAIALYCSSTEQARKFIADFAPSCDGADPLIHCSAGRFEWN